MGTAQSPHTEAQAKTDTPDILNQQMAKALMAGRGRVRTTQELVQNLGIDSRAASISPPNCRPVTDLVPKENQDQLMDRFFLSQQEAADHSRPSTAASELTVGSSEVTSAEPSRGPTPQAVETVEDLLAKLPPIDPSAVLEEWRQQEAEEEELGAMFPQRSKMPPLNPLKQVRF